MDVLQRLAQELLFKDCYRLSHLSLDDRSSQIMGEKVKPQLGSWPKVKMFMNSSGIQIKIYPKQGSSTAHITFLMVKKRINLFVRVDDALN